MVQGLTRKRFAFVDQDPPRARRRRLRASTSRPCCSTSSRCPSRPSPTTTGSRARRPSAAQLLAKDAEGLARTPLRALRRLEHAVEHPRGDPAPGLRGGRGARRGGLELRQPGARQCRSTSRSARTGASSGCAATSPSSSGSSRRSAAPSTTSCSPSSAARCAAGCTRAASAPRGWSCAPRSRSRSAPPTSAASSATRSPRCAARSPSTSRTRSKRLEVCRQGDGGDQAVEAGARRGGDLALQRLRPADPARAGGAGQLLDPAVQPRGHQRPRAADPALRARPRARGHLPGRLPAARTRRCSSRS